MRNMGRAAAAALLTLVAIALIATNAEAQNAAQAERLFNEAKSLFDAGKTREACEAWEASQRLDPSLGTLTNVANCREKAGDLATAWEAWISVERQTAGIGKYENLNNTAKTRAATLEPRLSYLTINVPDEVRIEGLVVLRDGVQIDPGAWNRALPIDGGKHMISGRAPGHETWSTTVEMQPEGDKQSVEVPRFKAIRNPGGGKTVVINRTAPSMFTPRRKIAVGVAAGGVVAIAAGAFLGMRARSLADDADARCPDNDECTLNDVTAAESLSHDAHRTAQFADLSFGVGIAAIGAGAFLWLTSKPAPHATAAETPTPKLSIEPRIAPSYAGVSAAVRF